MSAQDVTNHLNTLASDAPSAKKGWGIRALHSFANDQFGLEFLTIFLFALPPLFFVGAGFSLGANNESFMPLLIVAVSWGGIGAVFRLALHKMAQRYSSYHQQWDEILKAAQSISAHNLQHKDVIKRVVQLIDDPRPTYRWTAKLLTLMQQWRNEEEHAAQERRKQQTIELLTDTDHIAIVTLDGREEEQADARHSSVLHKEA